MKFAGLDLSKIDLRFGVSQCDLSIIHEALKINYEKGFGAIDYSDVDEFIFNVNQYLNINLVGITFKFWGYPPDYQRISKDSLRMATAIYMLPQMGLFDKDLQPYIDALNTFNNIEKINEIRALPFSPKNLHDLWKELKAEKSKLNITGFWDKSSNFIHNKVNAYLLNSIYLKLRIINNNDSSPIGLSLKTIYNIELHNYFKNKMKDLDYRVFMDQYQADGKNLRDLHSKVMELLGGAYINCNPCLITKG